MVLTCHSGVSPRPSSSTVRSQQLQHPSLSASPANNSAVLQVVAACLGGVSTCKCLLASGSCTLWLIGLLILRPCDPCMPERPPSRFSMWLHLLHDVAALYQPIRTQIKTRAFCRHSLSAALQNAPSFVVVATAQKCEQGVRMLHLASADSELLSTPVHCPRAESALEELEGYTHCAAQSKTPANDKFMSSRLPHQLPSDVSRI
jgi:hypothetical protein